VACGKAVDSLLLVACSLTTLIQPTQKDVRLISTVRPVAKEESVMRSKYHLIMTIPTLVVTVIIAFLLFQTGCSEDWRQKAQGVHASSVQIWHEQWTVNFGSMSIGLQGGNGGNYRLGDLKPGGPIRVVIFRDIPPGYVEVARKWGVKVGGAYVQKDRDKFEYICDVDLKLSDEDLAKTFGVENKFRGR